MLGVDHGRSTKKTTYGLRCVARTGPGAGNPRTRSDVHQRGRQRGFRPLARLAIALPTAVGIERNFVRWRKAHLDFCPCYLIAGLGFGYEWRFSTPTETRRLAPGNDCNGARPCENVREPRKRRIVFSIAFFGQTSPELLVFRLTKSSLMVEDEVAEPESLVRDTCRARAR